MAFADLNAHDQEVLTHLLARAKTWERVHFIIRLITSIPQGEEADQLMIACCQEVPVREMMLNNYLMGVLPWPYPTTNLLR